jgi:HSP20 family molecular chaperone IbpA
MARSADRSRCRPPSTRTRIAAEYKNGVLTVTLPFREEAKPRTINVEVAA